MTTRTGTFEVAKMSPLVAALTGLVLATPLLFGALAWLDPRQAGAVTLLVVALLAMVALVWLFARPTRFELEPDALVVVFPLRTLRIPRADVSGASRVTEPIHLAFGRAVRVGVGGLFGVFGLLWTGRRGWMTVYVTNTDRLVLVERRGARPLLVSPASPDAFVQAIEGA